MKKYILESDRRGEMDILIEAENLKDAAYKAIKEKTFGGNIFDLHIEEIRDW